MKVYLINNAKKLSTMQTKSLSYGQGDSHVSWRRWILKWEQEWIATLMWSSSLNCMNVANAIRIAHKNTIRTGLKAVPCFGQTFVTYRERLQSGAWWFGLSSVLLPPFLVLTMAWFSAGSWLACETGCGWCHHSQPAQVLLDSPQSGGTCYRTLLPAQLS